MNYELVFTGHVLKSYKGRVHIDKERDKRNDEEISEIINTSFKNAKFSKRVQESLDFLLSLPGKYHNSFDVLVDFRNPLTDETRPFYLTVGKKMGGLAAITIKCFCKKEGVPNKNKCRERQYDN